MHRTTNKLIGMLAVALVALALVPAAGASPAGGGAYGQHLPSHQGTAGSGAYGQHLPSPTQSEAPQSSVSPVASSNDFGLDEVGIVAGGLLLLGFGAVVLFTRRRTARTATVSS